jgi:hypothetical protein
MTYVGIALATAACGSGLWAAWKWREASLVPVDPGWGPPGTAETYLVPGYGIEARRHIQPLDPAQSNSELSTAIWAAASASARLNKVAAIWTAVSVALGGLSTFADAVVNSILTH